MLLEASLVVSLGGSYWMGIDVRMDCGLQVTMSFGMGVLQTGCLWL